MMAMSVVVIAQGSGVEVEQDAIGKRHFYGGQAVGVRHLLYLRAFYLGGLGSFLVHLPADDDAGARAYGRTYGCPDGGSLAFTYQATYNGPGGRARPSPDGSSLGSIVHGSAAAQHEGGGEQQCCKFHLFHTQSVFLVVYG